MNAHPVLFILDENREAYSKHLFCSRPCRSSFPNEENETLKMGHDYADEDGLVCETCGKLLGI